MWERSLCSRGSIWLDLWQAMYGGICISPQYWHRRSFLRSCNQIQVNHVESLSHLCLWIEHCWLSLQWDWFSVSLGVFTRVLSGIFSQAKHVELQMNSKQLVLRYLLDICLVKLSPMIRMEKEFANLVQSETAMSLEHFEAHAKLRISLPPNLYLKLEVSLAVALHPAVLGSVKLCLVCVSVITYPETFAVCTGMVKHRIYQSKRQWYD